MAVVKQLAVLLPEMEWRIRKGKSPEVPGNDTWVTSPGTVGSPGSPGISRIIMVLVCPLVWSTSNNWKQGNHPKDNFAWFVEVTF